MKKRVFASMMAAAMTVGSFAGMVSAAEEPVTIKVTRALFNLGAVDGDQVKKVETAINEYIADKINVQIELTELGSGTYSDVVSRMLTNNEINLLWTASWQSVIGTNDLVPMEAVYDLTEMLPGTPLYESMDAGQWEATKYNGKNYFVPVYKDNVEGYDLIWRKEIAEEHGWDMSAVTKLSDIEPMLEDAYNDGLLYPYLCQKTAMFYRWYVDSFDFFTADVTANWVSVDRETNEVVNTIQTPEYLEFCKLMADWADKGYISSDDAGKLITDTACQTQDWAFTWWTDLPDNTEASNRYKQEVEVLNITDRWAHSTSALGSCYCVTANSTEEEAQAAIDFLGLMFTDSKLADLYTFGIEGEDFEYDENGQVKKNPDGKYNHSMWESASATIVTPEAGEPADKADLYVDFNGGANTSCAAGFRFDKAPVEAAFSACQSVFNEYGFILENGGVAPDEVESKIAEYQAALDEAGYQDILAEFQNQYNEWKSLAESAE